MKDVSLLTVTCNHGSAILIGHRNTRMLLCPIQN